MSAKEQRANGCGRRGKPVDYVKQRSTIERYNSGLSLAQIARQDGVLPSAIHLRLKRAGVPRREVGRARLPVADLILDYCELRNWRLVGEKAGLTLQAVAQRTRARGFTPLEARKVRLLSPVRMQAWRDALDVDGLTFEDAMEIALEYREAA